MIFDVAAGKFSRAQIFRELLSRPLLRASVAASARRFDRDSVTWMQDQARQLPGQILNGAIGAVKYEAPGSSGCATEIAGRPSPKALAGAGKFADMCHRPN